MRGGLRLIVRLRRRGEDLQGANDDNEERSDEYCVVRSEAMSIASWGAKRRINE